MSMSNNVVFLVLLEHLKGQSVILYKMYLSGRTSEKNNCPYFSNKLLNVFLNKYNIFKIFPIYKKLYSSYICASVWDLVKRSYRYHTRHEQHVTFSGLAFLLVLTLWKIKYKGQALLQAWNMVSHLPEDSSYHGWIIIWQQNKVKTQCRIRRNSLTFLFHYLHLQIPYFRQSSFQHGGPNGAPIE